MKLVLISPKGPLYRHRGGIFKQNLRYAPLTLTTLAAYIPPELNIDVEIIDEGIEDVDLNLTADLIGMTVITGSSKRAYELADHYRARGIPVVLGGPHITSSLRMPSPMQIRLSWVMPKIPGQNSFAILPWDR